MDNIAENQDLMALLEQYNELKWSLEKNLKGEIPSIQDYINLIQAELMPLIEHEYNKMSSKVSNINSDNITSPELRDIVTASLRKLIPIYLRISALVVDPNCESVNNELKKELRKIIDNIILLASIFYDIKNSRMSNEQILKISKIEFNNTNYRFNSIKYGLKQLQNKDNSSKKNPLKSKVCGLLNKSGPAVLLFFVVALLFAHKYGPQNYIQLLDYTLKIVGWATILLWIPFYFLRTSTLRNRLLLPLLFSAIICILFSYGLWKGLLLFFILIVYPIAKILSIDEPGTARKAYDNTINTLFFSTSLSLFLAFVVTREPIWIIGLLIWLIWIYTSASSRRYFRPSFDNISKWDRTELIKDPWIFWALTASCILIIFNALGPISGNFLSNIYLISSQIAITLVGFLLAVQGFLGSSSLKSEGEKERRIEIEMILNSMEGLKGFMSLFTLLFIVSILGVFSTKNMSNLNMTIEWLTSPVVLRQSEIIGLYKTLLFASYVTILALSVSYLYYLFLSVNLFVLPFKFRLLSKPVLIEKFVNLTGGLDLIQDEDIKHSLYNEPRLNGRILQEVLINNLEDGLFANCKIEVAFPDKQDLMSLSKAIGDVLITKRGFAKVDVWAVSKQGSLGLAKVFQVELNAEKIEFLDKETSLDTEYKFAQIGARFKDFAYKESQLI